MRALSVRVTTYNKRSACAHNLCIALRLCCDCRVQYTHRNIAIGRKVFRVAVVLDVRSNRKPSWRALAQAWMQRVRDHQLLFRRRPKTQRVCQHAGALEQPTVGAQQVGVAPRHSTPTSRSGSRDLSRGTSFRTCPHIQSV